MDPVQNATYDVENGLFQEIAAHYGAPAYVRRARQVQDAYDDLLRKCKKQRDEWIAIARTKLGLLRALAGSWEVLLDCLEDETQLAVLHGLWTALEPRLRAKVEATSSSRTHRRALGEFIASAERFNRRWAEYLPTVDLAPINDLRDKYNRYYLLEKECALRSLPLARQGFERLAPMTREELADLFPLLPIPRCRTGC